MKGLQIIKKGGGISRTSVSQDGISGLLMQYVPINAYQKGKQGGKVKTEEEVVVYRLSSVEDAKNYGFTPEYDIEHEIFVYRHIAEFFRMNPNGDLFIGLLPMNLSYTAVVANALSFLKKAEGKIRQLGIIYNGTVPFNFNSEIKNVVAKAQTIYDQAYAEAMPCHILLEGRNFQYEAGVQNSPNLRSFNAPNVSVTIVQDLDFALENNWNSLQAEKNYHYADVGTVLGTISRAAVHQSIGWVKEFNIYGGSLTVAALSTIPISEIAQGDLKTLDEKGYILCKLYSGLDGIRLNGGPTCTTENDDLSYLEYARTMDKAVRGIYTNCLPFVESNLYISPQTQMIDPTNLKMIEIEASKAFERMVAEREISYYNIFIDPKQDILGTGILDLEFAIVPTGVARMVRATVGFKANI